LQSNRSKTEPPESDCRRIGVAGIQPTMYSSLVRIQNTFGFFTTVAFFVAALIAASDFITPREPVVNVLKTTSTQV
jgi:hypothetical protein